MPPQGPWGPHGPPPGHQAPHGPMMGPPQVPGHGPDMAKNNVSLFF